MSMETIARVIFFIVFLSVFKCTICQGTAPSSTTPADICVSYNNSCSDCISNNALCVWCSGRCVIYSTRKVFPDACPLSEARWLNCWVNFQVLLIMMGVIGLVIIIALLTCIYCCCCTSNGRRERQREQRENERANRAKNDRQSKSAEKKAERESRYDELRRKYGLSKGGGPTPYSRFDAGDDNA